MNVAIFIVIGLFATWAARPLFSEASRADLFTRLLLGVTASCGGGICGSVLSLESGVLGSMTCACVVLAAWALRELRVRGSTTATARGPSLPASL